jgi:hypothetical protein
MLGRDRIAKTIPPVHESDKMEFNCISGLVLFLSREVVSGRNGVAIIFTN